VFDSYLEVKWRLVLFREKYPHGVIAIEEICVDLDGRYARYKATVEDGEGGQATGFGTETATDFADFCERAETRASPGPVPHTATAHRPARRCLRQRALQEVERDVPREGRTG
jgi:hypothetical protein